MCMQCNQELVETHGPNSVYVFFMCVCVCVRWWGHDGLNRGCCFNSDFMCGFVLTPEVWFPLDRVQRLQGLLLLSSPARPT